MSKQKAKGAKPTHRLTVKDANGERHTVGAAWVDDRGWISIKLNAHVVLSEVQLRGGFLNLYPNDYREPVGKAADPAHDPTVEETAS